MIHTKSKGNLENATKRLGDILKKHKEYIPALVNLALAKFLLKKTSDARNFLKTALKIEY